MANETTLDDLAVMIKQGFDHVDGQFKEIRSEIIEIKSVMVTKDFLEEKLTDMKGDIIVLMRKEDTKLKTLVEILLAHKIISEEEKRRILSLEPFPQLV